MAEDTNMGMPWQQIRQEMKNYGWLHAAGSIIVVMAYLIYLGQARAGHSTPNAVTWIVGLITMMINFATYTYLTNTLAEKTIAAAATFMTGVVSIYALANGSFVTPTWYDAVCFCASIVVGVVWYKKYKTAKQAHTNDLDRRQAMVAEAKRINPLIQVIFLLSFVPTIIGVMNGLASELFIAWTIAAIGYICCTAANILTLANQKAAEREYASLPFLVINGIIGNGLVALIAYLK